MCIDLAISKDITWQNHNNVSGPLIDNILIFNVTACLIRIKDQQSVYASINVKPEGGGVGTPANVGHLTSIAFPTHRNLTKNLCPRVGTFAFSARRNGTKSHRTMCSSVRRSSWKLSTAVSNGGKSTCLYKNISSHYSFSI